MSEVIETLSLRFQSGNETPVERVMITRQEFEELDQQLKTANESNGFISVDDLVNSIVVTDEDKKLAEEYRKQIKEYFANNLEGK